jgi:hypothetical protein
MTETVKEFIVQRLKSAGFTAIQTSNGDINEIGKDEYAAFWRIKEISLGGLTISGSSTQCSAEITAEIRLMGTKCGFTDSVTLSEMAEKAMQNMLFLSPAIVKSIHCKDVTRNMLCGRLEYPLTAVIVTTIKKGE